MISSRQEHRVEVVKKMLNKVPAITVFFWVIKILCTTVGETVADYLNHGLGLGLTITSLIMGAMLIGALVAQFWARKYEPPIYWLAVVLLSVVGTLITDNLTDHLGVPLSITTAVFAVALAIVFAAWYAVEKSLSVHTIVTRRREAFYWSAILFTFALGTAAGDLLAEQLKLGYAWSVVAFVALIAADGLAYYKLHLNGVLAFWIAYVLTRPLGASLGDLLSQVPKHGGLGLGAFGTSALILATILGLVGYLTVTRKDVLEPTGEVARGAQGKHS
jgi:uncharacterized membrane-anchored protein